MVVDDGKYFLYRHIRVDKKQPFYVGIGTKRSRAHSQTSTYERANLSSIRNKIWKSIVSRSEYKIEILLESNDLDFIKQKEKFFISLYGRLDLKTGSLANLTEGGDGLIGHVCTDQLRKQRSEAFKGRKHTEEAKQKIALKNRLRIRSIGELERLKTLNVGRKHDKALYESRAKKAKGVKRSAECIAKVMLTKNPLEKRLLIKDMYERRIPKKHIMFLAHTHRTIINSVIKQFDLKLHFIYFREDGLGFLSEKEACIYMGVKQKRISRIIETKHRCGGFKWYKKYPEYNFDELEKLKYYRHA